MVHEALASAKIMPRGRNCYLIKQIKIKMSSWWGLIFSWLFFICTSILQHITLLQDEVKNICLTQKREEMTADLQPDWEVDRVVSWNSSLTPFCRQFYLELLPVAHRGDHGGFWESSPHGATWGKPIVGAVGAPSSPGPLSLSLRWKK